MIDDRLEELIDGLRLKQSEIEIFNDNFFERGWEVVAGVLAEKEKVIYSMLDNNTTQENHAYINGQLRMIGMLKQIPDDMRNVLDNKIKKALKQLEGKQRKLDLFSEL